jgi:hypothetical protein
MSAPLDMAVWLRAWGRALVRQADELEAERRVAQQSRRNRGMAAWARVAVLRSQGRTWREIGRELGEKPGTCKRMFAAGSSRGGE